MFHTSTQELYIPIMLHHGFFDRVLNLPLIYHRNVQSLAFSISAIINLYRTTLAVEILKKIQ